MFVCTQVGVLGSASRVSATCMSVSFLSVDILKCQHWVQVGVSCARRCVYIHISIATCLPIYVNMYVCMYVQICICICLCISIYIYIYIYIYSCLCV